MFLGFHQIIIYINIFRLPKHPTQSDEEKRRLLPTVFFLPSMSDHAICGLTWKKKGKFE